MASFKLTRMELLLTRKKLKLAEKGHKLLKEKRDVLIIEFFSTLREIKSLREGISSQLQRAQNALFNAQAIEGELSIQRAAQSLAADAHIELTTKSIMGVEFPQIKDIQVKHQWHGYFEQSVEFDNAIVQYRRLFTSLLRLAEKQLTLKHLAEEIKKTKRRVNALEYIIIPGLEEIKKLISFRLAELERENFTRLKMIKKLTAR